MQNGGSRAAPAVRTPHHHALSCFPTHNGGVASYMAKTFPAVINTHTVILSKFYRRGVSLAFVQNARRQRNWELSRAKDKIGCKKVSTLRVSHGRPLPGHDGKRKWKRKREREREKEQREREKFY